MSVQDVMANMSLHSSNGSRAFDPSTPVPVEGKIHSECQLVAWMAGHMVELPDVKVIPYVTCSKLHCFACYAWLQAYNKVAPAPISYDGSHGGLKPGWQPPSLQGTLQQELLQNLIPRLELEFKSAKHRKDASASSTSSHPLGNAGRSNTLDEERINARAQRFWTGRVPMRP
ncbi:hypothetical protein DFH07DRAFT_353625 [Mycena maculata]|uniref:Uncharacterized protein n=1 Tax=Mycena maculata TaxID=230809 RepID=A0AAD7HAY7_9AGAR|nr:hypothetical protein DFH07DRAFT_353625 [Mycena maculata]